MPAPGRLVPPPGQVPQAALPSATCAANSEICSCALLPALSEEHGRSQIRAKVVGELVLAEQVRLEDDVLHIDVNRQPVRRQNAISGAEIHGETLVSREFRAADAAQQVQRTVHGEVATDIHLAWKNVVAQREVVIRETPLSIGKQFDIAAEGLVAGLAGLRAAETGLEKDVFCHMVGSPDAVY